MATFPEIKRKAVRKYTGNTMKDAMIAATCAYAWMQRSNGERNTVIYELEDGGLNVATLNDHKNTIKSKATARRDEIGSLTSDIENFKTFGQEIYGTGWQVLTRQQHRQAKRA